jgi:hypothetical protein
MAYRATRVPYHSVLDTDQQGQSALYRRALSSGRRGQLLSVLTGRSRGLLSLEEVSRACTVQARSSGGTHTVAIAQICGSENRVVDFDCDFNPLQDHTQERWLGIAAARQRGRNLPAVALIQVGDRYFVRDGHHRISVARALGHKAIEAEVEVWQVDGPLPWEQPSQAPNGRRAGNHEEPRPRASGSRPALIPGWLRSAASDAVSGIL